MKKLIIIDAHNVIYKNKIWANLAESDINKARLALIQFYTNELRKKSHLNYIIVFDGASDIETPKFPNLEISFSGAKSADSLIKEYIKIHSGNYNIELISSDVELIKFAREYSGKSSSVNINFKSLNKTKEKPSGIGKKTFNELLSAFSAPLDDNWDN